MDVDHLLIARLWLSAACLALFVHLAWLGFTAYGRPWSEDRNGRRWADLAAMILVGGLGTASGNNAAFTVWGFFPLPPHLIVYTLAGATTALLLTGWWERRRGLHEEE